MRKVLQRFFAGCFFAAFLSSPVVAQVVAQQVSTPIIVHLQHSTDNLHAAKMALGFARTLKQQGADVTLLLTLEGARLADENQPIDMVWGKAAGQHVKATTIGDDFQAFVDAGGKVGVCTHCAAAAGCELKRLRKGAKIMSMDEMAKLVMSSGKILSY